MYPSAIGLNNEEDDDAKNEELKYDQESEKSEILMKNIDFYFNENGLIHFVMLQRKITSLINYIQVITKVV